MKKEHVAIIITGLALLGFVADKDSWADIAQQLILLALRALLGLAHAIAWARKSSLLRLLAR